MARPKAQEDALADLARLHKDNVGLGGDGQYKGSNTRHTFVCLRDPSHPDWKAMWYSVEPGGSGCPICTKSSKSPRGPRRPKKVPITLPSWEEG